MSRAVEIFARGARDGVYPGGQLLISLAGRRQVTASVGVLGGRLGPVSNQTIYDLASLTKPLATSVLLFRAIERGLTTLDAHLATYLPLVDPRITIRHALEHSAGYPAHLRFDKALPTLIPPGSWEAWGHIVRQAAQVELEAEPGARALYSDIGFILLGAVVESVYNMPLSAAFAQLGTALFFRDRRGPPAPPPTPTPHPIAPTDGEAVGVVNDENARAMGGAAGHAGLFGAASGVMALAESLVGAYHGDRGGLLSPESVRRMWKPSIVPDSTRTPGWDRPSERGSSTGGRWPKHSVGHLGFTGTSLWIEPERGFIVILVTNRVYPSRANNLIRRLRPALHDAAWGEWVDNEHKPSTEDPTVRIEL